MTRRILLSLIGVLALQCGFVTGAQAQVSRLYFAGYFGLTNYDDMDFTESSRPTSGNIAMKNGNALAGALGIRLTRHFRIEGEVGYAKTDMDNIDYSSGGAVSRAPLGGELDTWSGFANLYYDFDVDWSLQPFVSAGVGMMYHNGEILDGAGVAANANEDTAAFAWNVGAGAKYRMSPDLALTGAYRYVDSTDFSIGTYDLDYQNHEFRIGLEYDFPN